MPTRIQSNGIQNYNTLLSCFIQAADKHHVQRMAVTYNIVYIYLLLAYDMIKIRRQESAHQYI